MWSNSPGGAVSIITLVAMVRWPSPAVGLLPGSGRSLAGGWLHCAAWLLMAGPSVSLIFDTGWAGLAGLGCAGLAE